MDKIKRIIFSITFLILSSEVLFAQEIVTAVSFFENISTYYGDVFDYEAEISITQGTGADASVSSGVIYYKSPNLLRIDFTEPNEQVICATGSDLLIYLPKQVVVMTQKLKRHSDATLATMASSQGLDLLEKGYSISYLDGPDPVPLEEGSNELVTKLKLEWRTTEQGFRQIEMSIGKDNLIRRMKAVTPEMEEVQFDFVGIEINQNIPDIRFEYEVPASAYEIKNFLFEPEG
ncbi:MAG: outer-membrane lipoprotein carrier protein LolA [Spirochaetales bacterium]|uniref:Outer-membrane lipoprotein carrier protein LolA n=1 Tax=Candidatus Thalassospirochaeta sargassi TaxID=3119039 RepID=A0AAJ1MNE4_9SPIO|nr:outer-membrane lipoprotein carrier protein LolA [Spirochaetales bacterium]